MGHDDIFCWCGRLATVEHGGQNTCREHLNKKPLVKNKKANFRGDSQWQRENGYGDSKTGSNA